MLRWAVLVVTLAFSTAFVPQATMPALRLRSSTSTALKMAEKTPGEQAQEKFAEVSKVFTAEVSKVFTGLFEGMKAKVEETMEDMASKPEDEKEKSIAENTEEAEVSEEVA